MRYTLVYNVLTSCIEILFMDLLLNTNLKLVCHAPQAPFEARASCNTTDGFDSFVS